MIKKLFKEKKTTESSILFHPGIYKFTWPYISDYLVPDEDGYIKIWECEVEIRVGEKGGSDEDKIATVIITSAPHGIGITNWIEDIATKIRLSFFDYIFYDHLEGTDLKDEYFRWIEQYPPEFSPEYFPKGNSTEVYLSWDKVKKRYKRSI